jgi:hypothetical protein
MSVSSLKAMHRSVLHPLAGVLLSARIPPYSRRRPPRKPPEHDLQMGILGAGWPNSQRSAFGLTGFAHNCRARPDNVAYRSGRLVKLKVSHGGAGKVLKGL